MRIEDFTRHPNVVEIIQTLKTEGYDDPAGHRVSDVLDGAGHQYADLVQEGGGILGMALVGYTYVMEQMNIRFFSLAGASAGAINAMMLASHGGLAQPKSEWVLSHLVDKNFYDFVDGPRHVRKLIEAMLDDGSKLGTLLRGVWSWRYIKRNLGMNPGTDFYKWISGILTQEGIRTTADLNAKRSTLPDGFQVVDRSDVSTAGLAPKLVLIASEITTETRVQFPGMAKLFWPDPERVAPAHYVRASMSIPGFFHPYRPVRTPKDQMPEAMEKAWRAKGVRYFGEIPEEPMFVDGGIVSNFPIDVFHNPHIVPRLPTFGVKLGTDRDKITIVEKPGQFVGAVFNAARHVHDYEFIRRNPDYDQLVCAVNVGEHNWLNFEISDADKIDLFVRGAKTADAFLRKFNWSDYKVLRMQLLGQQPTPSVPA